MDASRLDKDGVNDPPPCAIASSSDLDARQAVLASVTPTALYCDLLPDSAVPEAVRAEARGYQYGPTFQNLTAMWRRGDEIFAGYDRYRALAMAAVLDRLPAHVAMHLRRLAEQDVERHVDHRGGVVAVVGRARIERADDETHEEGTRRAKLDGAKAHATEERAERHHEKQR